MPTNRPRAKHDEAYRLLFSSPALVEGFPGHILREFTELVDTSTLRQLSPSFVKPEALRQRHADMLWRAQLRKHGRHPIYLSFEFQSAPVANMAFRVYEYVGLMLREAEIAGDFSPAGKLPIVVPTVIYNGAMPWNAATDLADWIIPDAVPALGAVRGLQMRRHYILADLKTLKPVDLPPDNWFSVLVEWESARWSRDAARLGELWEAVLKSGEEGIVRGFLALRQQITPWLRSPDDVRREAESRERTKEMIRHEETWLAENLRKRDEELRQEGRQEGRLEGRRSLLRQLALQQFGPDGVAELSRLLDEGSDPDRDGALARAILECETVAEFIARARQL